MNASPDSTPHRMDLPPCALRLIGLLEEAGHEAWIVGGFVRDAFLGRPRNDIDIACSASWQAVKDVCLAAGLPTRETGVKHGTLTVIVDRSPIEVTTYRSDGAYRDGRRPEHVTFVSSIEEDLARRDFTINALAYHPERGFLDLHGGLSHLREGVIAAVGDPRKRFEEDALRILRACRFASQLGFSFESGTLEAMKACKSRLRHISPERIAHELDGFLLGEHIHDALMQTVDVLSFVVPELAAMKGFDQRTPYHIYDVLEHTAWVVQHTPPERPVRWAALVHDMGKPAAAFEDGDVRHFYGHAQVSVALGRAVLERLPMAPAFRDRVLALVLHHDDIVEPSARAVKRMLMKLGGDVGLFYALCDLKRADALSQAPHCAHRADAAERLKGILNEILEADEAFSLKQLAINGHDVMGLGVKPGPQVGKILKSALSAVVEEQTPNEREALLHFARAMLDQ